MKTGVLTVILVGSVLLAGCVSSGTHSQALTELEEARKAAAQTASDFDSFKKQAETNRQILAGKVATLTDELEKAKQRIATLTGDLATRSDEAARISQERDRLSSEVQKLQERFAEAGQARTDLTKTLAERDQELAKLRQELSRLQVTLPTLEQRLKAEEAEKARLEQERAAKEAEIQRLTRTHAELTKSLEAEIAKGDITIKQVRDRLTINMVDRVLFDSGQSQVKPAGLKVLKQVSDILRNVTDKQIRIEGHTDTVAIGIKLRERFPTNWELSTARATSVVRFLIEEGGVPRENLSAVGYADTRPVAGNDTEIGRTANRRIEIVLYPKDLSEIAGQIKP